MAAVDAERGVIAHPIDRPLGEVRKGFTPFADGDVIFARITPSMENGKAAIAAGLTNGLGFGSTEFHVMRPTESVLPEWVFHLVRQVSFRNEAKASFTGTAGQLRVPDSFVRSAPIPLPPLPEQQRLVEKIERLQEQSRTAREALNRIPPLLKRFRQAVLAKAFRGELTERDPNDEPASVLLERIRQERRRKWEEDLRAHGKDPRKAKYVEPEPPDTSGLPELPRGWAWGTIGALVPPDGLFVDGDWIETKDQDPDGDIRLVQLADIGEGEFRDKSARFLTSEKANQLGCTYLRMGDVLIARMPDPLGRACLFPGATQKCVTAVDVCIVRLEGGMISNRWLVHALNSPDFRGRVLGMQTGTTRGRISRGNLSRIPLPVPPANEQIRIASRVEGFLSASASIVTSLGSALRHAEQVDQAVLARAFRGEL
jgi:type I restriction enzyme S subunit